MAKLEDSETTTQLEEIAASAPGLLVERKPASVAHGMRDAVHQVFESLNQDLRDALPAVEAAGTAKEGKK